MDSAQTLTLLLDRVIDSRAAHPDADTTGAILEEAARFAQAHLAPLASIIDRGGCALTGGRVRMAPEHVTAWQAFAAAGWAGLAGRSDFGGQELPLAVVAAVQELFDAAAPAFGMMAINARCAIRLLERHGDPVTRETWLPKLTAGTWGATICISESQAGSDVGRIRTRAAQDAAGLWRLTGEKCWISFGDHDLTDRIGHFALARAVGAPAGTRGLSLFLVPDTLDDGTRNGITVTRLEHKLGLHGSPTCTLAFDGAVATPVGPMGRGLPTLFSMIVAMRLGVSAQGAAVAQAAAAVAERYAGERAQGGDPEAAATPITRHAEVRRLLLEMRARAEAARLIALQSAAWVDAGEAGDSDAAARAAMLLPVAKTFGAEAAFANADAAIQVLGGAGYVSDWPVECMLRDARVFSIYEGTTGIQGLDLLLRRVQGEGGRTILRDLLACLGPDATIAATVQAVADELMQRDARVKEWGAVPFLRLLGLAAADGLLRRASRQGGILAGRYAALSLFFTSQAVAEAARLASVCRMSTFDGAFDAAFSTAAQ